MASRPDEVTEFREFQPILWKPWREATILALILMELSWIVPWYRSLTPVTYATPTARVFLSLFGIYLITHLCIRFMNYLRIRLDIRRWVMVLLFAGSTLIGLKVLLYPDASISLGELIARPFRAFNESATLIPDEFLIVLIILVVCWRGISLAQVYVEPVIVMRHFQLGILMFLIYVFFNTIVTGETPGSLIYLFLFSGLIAMGTSRILVLSTLRGGRVDVFDRRWFIGVITATLAVVAIAGLVASLAEGGRLLEQIGAILLGLLILIAVAVISPAIFFLPLLFGMVPFLAEGVRELVDALQDLQSMMGGMAGNLFEFMDESGIFNFANLIKPFLMWSCISVIALIILASLTRWVLKDRNQSRDERANLLNPADLLQLLQSAMHKNLSRIGERFDEWRRNRAVGRHMAAARIRQIYAELMELCDRLHTPRPAARTPLEYLSTLDHLFPGEEEDLATITQAYLKVRYGELAESQAELNQVELAWARVRAQGIEQLNKEKLEKSTPR
jgi:hypothetical protein